MLHLRVTSPPDRTAAVATLLEECPGIASLAVVRGASIRPPGDLVLADVARESTDQLLTGLRDLRIDVDGTISMEAVDTAVSQAAERAERTAPGKGADAVIWEEVVRRTSDDAVLSWTFLAFLFLATALAAIAVVLDSAILVIGAMVVGPEFVPLAAVAVGLVHGRTSLLRRGAVTLVVGFACAIAATTLLCLLARAAGWISIASIQRPRPFTAFIWAPDRWSFVVAFIAGVAGVLSLTSSKSAALVGVFISVTTVPAAGNFAIASALGDLGEMAGSAAQLGVNMSAIVLAGVATLVVQKVVGRAPYRKRRGARAGKAPAISR